MSVVGGSFGGGAAARASVVAPGEIDRLVLLAPSALIQTVIATGILLGVAAFGVCAENMPTTIHGCSRCWAAASKNMGCPTARRPRRVMVP